MTADHLTGIEQFEAKLWMASEPAYGSWSHQFPLSWP